MGYRWFDAFGKTPAYPFGYGRSYTSFSIQVIGTELEENRITVSAQVTNTGKRYQGREVVQIYTSAPEGMLDKPYQVLAAYAKTKSLRPGESIEIVKN